MFPTDSLANITLGQWLGVAAAYALGCCNTGYYLVRWKTGGDLRETGSGNAGARNTGRVLGRWGFAASLLGDMAKGALAVAGARLGGFNPAGQGLVLLAVIAGHNWPVQLGGRGGKGAAVSCGGLLCFDPLVTGLMLGLTALLGGVTRRYTLGAMGAYVAGPVLAAGLGHSPPEIAVFAATAGLVVFSHRSNLRQELTGRGVAAKP